MNRIYWKNKALRQIPAHAIDAEHCKETRGANRSHFRRLNRLLKHEFVIKQKNKIEIVFTNCLLTGIHFHVECGKVDILVLTSSKYRVKDTTSTTGIMSCRILEYRVDDPCGY